MIYNISNEPTYGFKRRVEVAQINIGFTTLIEKSINIILVVNYYNDEGEPISIIPPKCITLKADSNTWVDSNGFILPEDDPSVISTEYDYFMQMIHLPIVISDIIQAKIAWADQVGKFD